MGDKKGNTLRNGEEFEKRPWSSKKFAFAMTQVILWKAIIVTSLVLFTIFAEVSIIACIILCLLIMTPGVIEVQYLGGQKALDQYVRLASLTAGQITDGGKDLLNKVDNALDLDLIEDEVEVKKVTTTVVAEVAPEPEPEPEIEPDRDLSEPPTPWPDEEDEEDEKPSESEEEPKEGTPSS